MQGRSYQPGSIRRLGQVGTEAAVYEVGHALGWCRLMAVALLPAEAFKVFLQEKHVQ